MSWTKRTLSDIRRLLATLERTDPNRDVVQAVIDLTPAEPMAHGRVTLETLINLLDQLGGTTVLPEEVLALLRQPEPPLTEPPTGPVIDCDAPAIDIENARVLHHHLRGQIVWDPRLASWYTPANQAKQICEPELAEQPTMNMCAMEYLRHHQQLIPPDWQRFKLFFPGTTYSCGGMVYVPFLHYEKQRVESKWERSFASITHRFEENDVIVLYQPTEPAAAVLPPQPTFNELIAACRFVKLSTRINEDNFPLTDDGTTGPIEEIILEDVTGKAALEYIRNHGCRPVGMRRALEYIAQNRQKIIQHHKQIAILGSITGVSSPVALPSPFKIETYSVDGKYYGTFHYLVTRE